MSSREWEFRVHDILRSIDKSEIPWDQMNGMRNILIHEYFGVDIKIVWHTVKKYLPSVQKQLISLLLDSKNHS